MKISDLINDFCDGMRDGIISSCVITCTIYYVLRASETILKRHGK